MLFEEVLEVDELEEREQDFLCWCNSKKKNHLILRNQKQSWQNLLHLHLKIDDDADVDDKEIGGDADDDQKFQ